MLINIMVEPQLSLNNSNNKKRSFLIQICIYRDVNTHKMSVKSKAPKAYEYTRIASHINLFTIHD